MGASTRKGLESRGPDRGPGPRGSLMISVSRCRAKPPCPRGHSSLQSRRSLIPGTSRDLRSDREPGRRRRRAVRPVAPPVRDRGDRSVKDRKSRESARRESQGWSGPAHSRRRIAAGLLLARRRRLHGLRRAALHHPDRTPRGPGHRQRRGDRAHAGLAGRSPTTATGRSPSSSTATRPRRSSSRSTAPWWDNLLTEFFTENLVPFTLRDEREFTYELTPAQAPRADDLRNRAEQLRSEARIQPKPRRGGILGWFGFD